MIGVLSIDFSAAGDGAAWTGHGWSSPEMQFTWMLGGESVLRLPPLDAPSSGRLTLALLPFARPPQLPTQLLEVVADDAVLARFELGGEAEVDIDVPAPVATVPGLHLVLRHPRAVKPSDFDEVNDQRPLSFALKWLRWRPLPANEEQSAVTGALLVAGRLQSVELPKLAARTAAFGEGREVRWLDSGGAGAEARLLELGADADCVWLQADADGRAPLRATAESLPRRPRVLTYPALSMELLWPFNAHDPRLRQEPPNYPNGLFPFGDAVGAAIAAELGPNIPEGADDDALILRRYQEIAAERLPEPDAALADFATRLLVREATCDVRVAGYIVDTFREEKLFHNALYPAGPLIRRIATELMLRSGLVSGARLGRALRELDDLTLGYAGIDFEQTPINPLVARSHRLRWFRADATYQYNNNGWSFADYMIAYVRWRRWSP